MAVHVGLVASRLVAAVAVLVGGSANELGGVSYGDRQAGRREESASAVGGERSCLSEERRLQKRKLTRRRRRNFASSPFRWHTSCNAPRTHSRTID